MENNNQKSTTHPIKDIQQNTNNDQVNGKPGTSYAEDTQKNKDKAEELPIAKRADDSENTMDDEERMGNNGL